jgi:hypothetical protein
MLLLLKAALQVGVGLPVRRIAQFTDGGPQNRRSGVVSQQERAILGSKCAGGRIAARHLLNVMAN